MIAIICLGLHLLVKEFSAYITDKKESLLFIMINIKFLGLAFFLLAFLLLCFIGLLLSFR